MSEEQQPIAGAPDQPLRFCYDCRWIERHLGTAMMGDASLCTHPRASKPPLVNLVTGEVTPQRDPCSEQRGKVAEGICGIAGQWWETRERPDPSIRSDPDIGWLTQGTVNQDRNPLR